MLLGVLVIAPAALSEPIMKAQRESYGRIPLSFESNEGQTDSAIKFLSRGIGYSIFFKDDEAVVVLSKEKGGDAVAHKPSSGLGPTPPDFVTDMIRMRLKGIGKNIRPMGKKKLSGTVNYFHGSSPAAWHTGISTFGKVKYSGVYPGVDLVYYGNQQRLEFDFEIAAGADIKPIRLQFAGARKLRLDAAGNLTIQAPNGKISFHKPVIYQTGPGEQKQFIQGSFFLVSSNTIGFRLGAYDHTKPLVIDPILSYSTYLGHYGRGNAVTVDAAGNAYITGWAENDFPTTEGSPQPIDESKYANVYSAFVSKLNSSGTALVYSTYLSGSDSDEGTAIAVDPQGNAYVAGTTSSADFPITAVAFQTANKAIPYSTGFVTKLNSTGTALLYSTFLGGGHLKNSQTFTSPGTEDKVVAIAVNANGEAYAAGFTGSTDFPVTAGTFQPINKASVTSTFLTKLNSGGTGLVYSTYLSGSGAEEPMAAALDSAGNFYVTGATTSTDLPTTAGSFQRANVARLGWTTFLTKMNPTGTSLVYSTYFGGSRTDGANAIAIDSAGTAYLAGFANSADLPVTPGAYQPAPKPGSQNAFVARFNDAGNSLIYSTYIGGSTNEIGGAGEDTATGIAIDSSGNAIIVGSTDSMDFPITSGAFATQNTTWLESLDPGSFLAKLNSTGTSLLYSTYLGGSGDLSTERCDCASGIAADSSGNLYVTGNTVSTDFPITPGAFQASQPLGNSAFLTKFTAAEMKSLPATTTTVTTDANPQIPGAPVTFTVAVHGTGSSTPSGSVGVSVNGNPWSTYTLDAAGSATYSTSILPSGPDTIVTYYLGDANNAPSTNYFHETIASGSGDRQATITVTPNANPVAYGTPVNFDISVQDPSGNGIPAGSAMLVFNYRLVNQAILDASGHATLTTKSLPAGTDQINVNFYPSNRNYASRGIYLTETVVPLGVSAPPAISLPSGTYPSGQTVTITSVTPGTIVYYTTDGSTPTANSMSAYIGPINITHSTTVKAIAAGPGYSDSPMVSATYSIGAYAVTPVIAPASGTYLSAQKVEITDALPDASIYYTTDGSVPTIHSSLYTGPFTVHSTTTIQAAAIASGYALSKVASVVLTIDLPDFAIALSPSSLAVSAGHSATTVLTVNPVNGFNQPVSFSCSGLPPGLSCSFSPASITSGALTTTLTLSANMTANGGRFHLFPIVPLTSLAIVLFWTRSRKRLGIALSVCLVAASASLLLLSGCGGATGGTNSRPAPAATNASVTASSGSLVHNATLQVTIN